jgi:hypothetical protein
VTDSLHNHEDGPSPAVKAALAALQAEDDMPTDARARVWDRLAADVAAEDLADRTGRRWRSGVVIGLALAAGVVLAIAGLRGAAVPVAGGGAAPEAQYGGETAGSQLAQRRGGGVSASVPPPVVEAVAPVVELAPAAAEAVAEAEHEPTDRSPRTGRKRQVMDAPVDAPEVEEPALGREAALLQRAQAALAGSRAAEALMHLATYDREFGASGVLRPEHDGLRAVALCAAGRAEEGRAAADGFLRAHAGSVQAERVRGACAGL